MIRNAKKIPIKLLYIMFLLFPLVKADVNGMAAYFGNIISEVVDDVLVLWQFISLGLSLLALVHNIIQIGKKAISRFFLFECILCIVLTYSTITNSTMPIYRIFRELLPGFVFLLVANNNKRENTLYFIKAVYYDLSFLMVINSLSMYLFQPWLRNSGDAVYYLFGLDNYSFMISFCAFSAGVITQLAQKGRMSISFYVLFAFIDGAYFYTKASTAIVVSLLCIAFCFVYKKKIVNILNWKRVLIVLGVIFFLIVGSDFVASRFSGVFSALGKLPNFSGRTHIWMIAFTAARKRLLFGYGIESDTIKYLMTSYGLGWEIGHLHNVILEYLVKGGIVGFGIFISMWLTEIAGHRKIKRTNIIIQSIYVLFIFSFLIYMFDYRIADCSAWIFIVMLSEVNYIKSKEQMIIDSISLGWKK